jgi:DNA polymerase-3 subunit beta
MKLVAGREALYQGFARVGSVIGSSTQQPLFRNVKLQTSGDTLCLSATDLEVGLLVRVPGVQVQEQGAVLLPNSRISPILGATPDETVAIRDEDGTVVVEAGESNFRILGENPDDFPDLAVLPAEGVVEIDPEVLRYMVRRTSFAAASEKGRYALNGVLFVIGPGDNIELVSADGARLAQVQKKVSNPDGVQKEFIVMLKGVERLGHLASYSKEPVRFTATERQFIAENDAGRLACQLVEGQFPNYKEVIPTEFKVKAELPTMQLQSAVRRASYVTTDEAKVVDFKFEEGMLTVLAEAADVGRAEIKVAAEYTGEGFQISLNPDFVDDMLAIVERESVKMRFTDRRSPCVIKSGVDYTYVISPVIREEAGL